MTTQEYDRVVEKLKHLHQVGMSVSDFKDQYALFGPELSPEQIELLEQLDNRATRSRRSEDSQPGLF
jgi:hypothetical protein